MSVKKGSKKLNRRTMLRGMGIAGIAIALPPLEAMIDTKGRFFAVGAAQSVAQPKRLVQFHWGNGAAMGYWKFDGSSNIASDSILRGLVPGGVEAIANSSYLHPVSTDVSPHINVVRGLSVDAVASQVSGADKHAVTSHCFSTGTVPVLGGASGNSTTSVSAASSISFDQLAADHIRADTPVRALVIAARDQGGSNDLDIVRKAYSFGQGGATQDYFSNPKALFDEVFSGLSPSSEPDPQLEQLKARRQSVLDFVGEDITKLKGELGSNDQARLDKHLTSIRELELKLEAGPRSCELPAAPASNPPQDHDTDAGYQNRVEDFLQLIELALLCDLTRAVHFCLGTSNESHKHLFLGHTINDHLSSHSNPSNNPEGYLTFAEVARWKVSRFARLIEKLNQDQAEGSTLLDHCVVVASSEMGDQNHKYDEIPVMVAGKVGGMATGKSVSAGSGVPLTNLWLTALRAVGVDASSAPKFGNSTGTVSGLWI